MEFLCSYREQRVTLFLMAFMVSLSVMAYSVLKLLPLPVLYGLILYLGVASLHGLQFTRRVLLFLIPTKHRPDIKYLRQIPNRRIYMYTGIQIVFLLLLCVFQVYFYLKAIFPIMVSLVDPCISVVFDNIYLPSVALQNFT